MSHFEVDDQPTEIDPPGRFDEALPVERSEEEIRALVDEGLSLVDLVARQLRRELGTLTDHDELASIGRAALVEAARAFDPARANFNTYARKRLRWAMLDSFRRETHGRSVYSRALALHAAEEVVESAVAERPDPTLAEAAHAERLGAILGAQAAAMALGLSAPYRATPPDAWRSGAQPETGPKSVVRPSEPPPMPLDEEDPELVFSRSRSEDALRDAIDRLPKRQREIIERHYFHEERFDHIATSLGLSKSWLSRLHAQAMEALSRAMRGHR